MDEVNELCSKALSSQEEGMIFHSTYNMIQLSKLVEKLGDISLFERVSAHPSYNTYMTVLIARRDNECYWRTVPFSRLTDKEKDYYSIDTRGLG